MGRLSSYDGTFHTPLKISNNFHDKVVKQTSQIISPLPAKLNPPRPHIKKPCPG